MTAKSKPKLAVWKFASCDGCQLSLLDCEDELLAVTGEVEIAYFLEASRRRRCAGPSTCRWWKARSPRPGRGAHPRRAPRLKTLITIGACATAGGIKRCATSSMWTSTSPVYAHPEYVNTLATSTPVSEHVYVDFQLRGCPINKWQLIEVVCAFLNGRKPVIPTYSVCMECKRRGITCVMVAHGTPCLGPVTQAGCGALCPSYNRGCYGCFGPMDTPNPAALSQWWSNGLGVSEADLVRAWRGFNAYAEPFRKESEAHEHI